MVFALPNQSNTLSVNHYGTETISSQARWGKGVRNVFLLHYVLTGEGFFNDCKVKAGEGFLIRPGALHEYHSSQENPWQYFWVVFGGTEAETICQKHISANQSGIFSFDLNPAFLNLTRHIMEEENQFSHAKALGYFFFLMSFHKKTEVSSRNHYVQDAKKYMNIHFYRTLSITEVAKAVCISDRYLYNLFIKHEGISPKQYLNQLRLTSAQSMLKNTDYSISEIANSVGFPDVLAFSKFFSKNMRISPTEYRKQ